jgi:hypothetical protein
MRMAKQTKKAAYAMFDRIRVGLVDLAEAIQEVVDSKAWETIGYESLAEAWDDLLSDVTLPIEVRPVLVYAMLEAGEDGETIAHTVKGISEATVKTLAQQKGAGVPAKKATVRKKRASRGPATHKVIQFKVDAETFKEWEQTALFFSRSVDDIVKEGAEQVFKQYGVIAAKSAESKSAE